MTDYLSPPPAEIVLEPVVPGKAEYDAQGGANHKFWVHNGNGYFQVNAYQYEQNHRSMTLQRGMIESFEESLKEALSQGEIETDVAQTFAGIFGINLSREYEVTVTVQFSLSIELPMDEDVERFVDNLNFSVDEPRYSDGEVTASDWEVTDTNWTDV